MQNLQLISTKELRDNLAEVLEKVAIGQQTFLVSKFGREKALITPIKNIAKEKKKEKRNLRSLSFYGTWEGREDMKSPAIWVSELRKGQSFRILEKTEE